MTTSSLRISPAALIAAFVLFLAMSGVGLAQVLCPAVKVNNQTNCTINLCLYDSLAGVVTCHMIPAGAPNTPFPFPAGFVPTGVQTASGNHYAFPAQPPSPACTPCINLGPLGAVCCATVCYDQTTCRILISNCASPCLP